MAAEHADAIVLRTVEFSETSLIVTLFTREWGKVQAIAKGGRRIKGPFESGLDILARLRVTFLRKTSDALDLLTEAKLIRRFRPSRENLAGLHAGYYLVELLGLLTQDYDPYPLLYIQAGEALDRFEAGHEVATTLLWFELQMLGRLGHMPSLDQCVGCGEPLSLEMRKRIPFGHLDGGVLCGKCRGGRGQVASVTTTALTAMQQLAQATETADLPEPPEPKIGGEIRGLLNHYFSHLIGKKPRAQAFLET